MLGSGNMAGALIRGLIASGTVQKDQVRASDVRRERLDELHAEFGIETRDFCQPCSQQPAYRERFGDCAESPVTADIARRGLYLPSGLALTAAQLDRVCAAIERLAGR